eukprot:384798-Alexandrium_andersonii.AAC.1
MDSGGFPGRAYHIRQIACTPRSGARGSEPDPVSDSLAALRIGGFKSEECLSIDALSIRKSGQHICSKVHMRREVGAD